VSDLADGKISRVKAIQQFFAPITPTEIMRFAKEDRKGYEECAALAATALGLELEVA
jgi:hypothetical protein